MEDLLEYDGDVGLGHDDFRIVDELGQIADETLHREVEVLMVVEDLDQLDDVWVVDFFEDPHLSDGRLVDARFVLMSAETTLTYSFFRATKTF